MATSLRAAVALAFVAGISVPAGAQGERCSANTLGVDARPVVARFCIPLPVTPGGVSVTETFSARGLRVVKSVTLTIVPGARTSRAVDDVDLTPLGIPRTLHVTLAYRGGGVELEHALALPGAVPVK